MLTIEETIRLKENVKIDNNFYENSLFNAQGNIGKKPSIEWFNIKNEDLTFDDACHKAIELISYWEVAHKGKIPSWIEIALKLKDTHFQRDAVIRMLALIIQGKPALQLLAGTGTGKTYMYFSLFDIMVYYDYIMQLQTKEGKFYPFPFVIFTPNSVVEQSNSVKRLYPNISKVPCMVTTYETLRTKNGLGNIFIKWKTISIQGEIEEVPEWSIDTAPPVILLDENQKLKNNGSMQTKLIQAYNNLKHARICKQVFCSATPFVKPIEAKTVCLALSPMLELKDEYIRKVRKVYVQNLQESEQTHSRIKNIYDLKEIKIDHIPRVMASNWEYFLKNEICGTRINPTDYSPAAMERLTDFLSSEYQLVTVNDVKFQHKTINKHVLIDFLTIEEKKVYDKAYEEYVNELLKHDKSEPGGMAAIFVAMLKWRMAAELCRAKHLAKMAYDKAYKGGKSVIMATAFKETQEAILGILVTEFKVPIEEISLIRGGQSKGVRWDNVNKFQDEKSKIILVMIQAGGVGLSLHHHKDRNHRPRHIIMPPVWSIIEMLQMLGRGHRINSASTTTQDVVWYRGTIEADVAERLKHKALSMRELMRKKEQWSELFVEESLRTRINLKETFEEGENELISKDISDNDADDNGDEDKKDPFNLDEQTIAENIIEVE